MTDTALVGDEEIDYQAERGPRPPLMDTALVLLTIAVVVVHPKLSDIMAVIVADLFLKVSRPWTD